MGPMVAPSTTSQCCECQTSLWWLIWKNEWNRCTCVELHTIYLNIGMGNYTSNEMHNNMGRV